MSRIQGILKFRISMVQEAHDFLLMLKVNHGELFNCCDSIMRHYVNMNSTNYFFPITKEKKIIARISI